MHPDAPVRLPLLFGFLAALIVGCSLLGAHKHAELSIHFFTRSAAKEQPDFLIAFTDGRTSRRIQRNDFNRVGAVQFDAGPFEISTSGTLRVFCRILEAGGEVLATQKATLSVRPDWRYSVSCSLGRMNPYHACFGCTGFEAQPLDSALGFAPGDSLFVVWGGTSISNPVMY